MSEFTRNFTFEDVPLFSKTSPWRQRATNRVADSERRARAIFDILREQSILTDGIRSVVSTPGIYDQLSACRAACEADWYSTECRKCRESLVERISGALPIAFQGGHKQTPWVAYDEWSFPIFETNIESDFLADVPVRGYDDKTWLSQALPPEFPLSANPDFQSPQLTFKVPMKVTPRPENTSPASNLLRPAGPTGTDSDGAIILYNPATHSEFDFWQATTATEGIPPKSTGGGVPGDRILAAGAAAYFKVKDGTGRFPDIGAQTIDGLVERRSSRASGLPYLGGLLISEDLQIPDGGSVEDIAIHHAFAFTLPRLRYLAHPMLGDPPNFVFPATSTETFNYTQNPYALAAGQRIRLKCDGDVLTVAGNNFFDFPNAQRLPQITKIFLKALQEYGAYLVDGGGAFGFVAEDYRTANLTMDRNDLIKLVRYSDDPDPYPIPANPSPAEIWRIAMDKLNASLSGYKPFLATERLTFGFGDNTNGYHMNFEVVEDLEVPAP